MNDDPYDLKRDWRYVKARAERRALDRRLRTAEIEFSRSPVERWWSDHPRIRAAFWATVGILLLACVAYLVFFTGSAACDPAAEACSDYRPGNR